MSARFRPLYFGPPGEQHFGLLHLPVGAARPRLGVVICNPFGYEEICAHRALREFAELLAVHGMAALRFDYAGTGDSEGECADGGLVSAWQRGIRLAVQELRAQVGDVPVALAGLRLGATLAALSGVQEMRAFVALAPVTQPRAYLRELRALQATSGGSAAGQAEVLEAAGFGLNAQAQSELAALDPTAATWPPGAHVLMLDRDDLPVNGEWAARLRTQGCLVEQQRIAGYARWMTNPHKGVVPRAALQAAVSWLQSVPVDDMHQVVSPARLPPPEPAVSGTWRCRGSTIRETALHLGSDSRLFAVVSEPAERAATGRRAVLLLNAGATHRIGPGRMATDVARRAAAQGLLAMRLDVGGIGDSIAAPGEEENVVYSRTAVDDVQQAVESLRTRFQASQVIVVGLCSGAYHALQAAVAQVPIDMIVMLNPLTFRWTEGMSLDDQLSPHEVVRDVGRYRRNLFRPDTWARMLRGRVALGAALRNLAVHAGERIRAAAADAARHVGIGGRGWSLAAELEGISRRGVRMRFIFSRGEPGVDLLHLQAGATVRRLGHSDLLRIDFVDGADHTFTTRVPRERMFEQLFLHLDGKPG